MNSSSEDGVSDMKKDVRKIPHIKTRFNAVNGKKLASAVRAAQRKNMAAKRVVMTVKNILG